LLSRLPPPLLLLLCCFPAGEDDGYLMVYVTKPDGLSYMHIYDAASMDSTPVAEVSVTVCVCVSE
jgi:carotenoid cleavage dioxygenase-like enzyme